MNIESAISRIKWRIENGHTNKKDVDAYNTIAKHFQDAHEAISSDQVLFSKLLLYIIRKRAETNTVHIQDILREVEEVLKVPLHVSLEEFKKEVPVFRFGLIAFSGTEGLDPVKDFGKIKRIAQQNMRENKKALQDSLTTPWTLEQAHKFLETQVAKMTIKYAGKP
jgi:hypothetical protein